LSSSFSAIRSKDRRIVEKARHQQAQSRDQEQESKIDRQGFIEPTEGDAFRYADGEIKGVVLVTRG